jgi:hypothetical protein
MPEKPNPTRKASDKSTKQELVEAYNTLAKQLDEKRASELAPQRQLEEKKTAEAVQVAGGASLEGIDREIGTLRADIVKSLAEIADKLAGEIGKFKTIQQAVESKQRELQELYGIEKSAVTLAALIETNNQKRREFEVELEGEKAELQTEVETTRLEWEKEKKAREAEVRERDAAEKKAREREREEFFYAFKREQQSLRDKLNDEKATLEKALHQQKETGEKELAGRERAIAEKEQELAHLRERAAAFPGELETKVNQSVKEISDRLKLEAKNREELLHKDFEGQRNVLAARLEALERVSKDLGDQNAKMSKQLEVAYQKVQDIAEKAVEGSSQAKSFAELKNFLADQSRKSGEKS